MVTLAFCGARLGACEESTSRIRTWSELSPSSCCPATPPSIAVHCQLSTVDCQLSTILRPSEAYTGPDIERPDPPGVVSRSGAGQDRWMKTMKRDAARIRTTFLFLVALSAVSFRAGAEVVKVDVATRADVGGSGYEKIVGTIHFAVDPRESSQQRHRRSGQSADERAGPRRVLGRPVHPAPEGRARSNGVALIEVSNRGRKGLLSGFSRATSRRARSFGRCRPRRRLPDEGRLHARVGRLAVRRATSRRTHEARCAGGIRHQRHRARRVHAERTGHRNDAGRSRRLLAGRSASRPIRRSRFGTAPTAAPEPLCRASVGRSRATR